MSRRFFSSLRIFLKTWNSQVFRGSATGIWYRDSVQHVAQWHDVKAQSELVANSTFWESCTCAARATTAIWVKFKLILERKQNRIEPAQLKGKKKKGRRGEKRKGEKKMPWNRRCLLPRWPLLLSRTTDLGLSIRVSRLFEHVDWWLGPLPLVPCHGRGRRLVEMTEG